MIAVCGRDTITAVNKPTHPSGTTASPVRLDKWLWAARFYKTRRQATDEIAAGRVHVNGQPAKPSRDVRIGDRLSLRQGNVPTERIIVVRALSDVRGPAPVAQSLYDETPQSILARESWLANRRFLADPAQAMEQGRPTKQARRQLAQWQRWSATLDETGS